jgi:hypothetical protein
VDGCLFSAVLVTNFVSEMLQQLFMAQSSAGTRMDKATQCLFVLYADCIKYDG